LCTNFDDISKGGNGSPGRVAINNRVDSDGDVDQDADQEFLKGILLLRYAADAEFC